MNLPPSACGSYEVTVQSTDGQKLAYKVAGFKNGESERYDSITSLINKAKEQNTSVALRINNKGYIIAAK